MVLQSVANLKNTESGNSFFKTDAGMLVVIGCGNLARSDDGVGVSVVHRLVERFGANNANVRLIDAGTAGMEVMYQVRGAGHVVIVDACSSGSEPGAVFRLPGSEAQTPGEPGFTQHGVRWDHALYAGTRMFGEQFTRYTEVFLIEAQTIDFGIGLSAAVARGADRVIGEIEALIESRTVQSRPQVWLHRGRLHLNRVAAERYLLGCPIVALMARDDSWLLMPLHGGAGGLQVKLRNARGDRVIEAQEFFRAQGLEDSEQIRALQLFDDPERGALKIEFADQD